MKVYIMIGHVNYEGDDLLGVCSTEEKAVGFLNRYPHPEYFDNIVYREMEVDA